MIRFASSLVVILFTPISLTFASHHPECPDESNYTVTGADGNRYGWFEDTSCVFVETEVHRPEYLTCPEGSNVTSVGGNGISYGWYQEATCIIADGSNSGSSDEPSGDSTPLNVVEETIEGEFSEIAGAWETIRPNGTREVRQIIADGTYTVWTFVPELEEYLGLDREQIDIVLSFMDDELIAAGYLQAQIDFLRQTRECWVLERTGTISDRGDGFFLTTEVIIDIGTATGTTSFSREEDNLVIGTDQYSSFNGELNLCSEA